MIEVVGDSARGDEFALVRLTVDGDRIVAADAPGLARPLEGLTLLEAAAVPGETLAADALANALAPVFRAATRRRPDRGRDERRRRQRGRAAAAGPDAIGVTLRLWLDPAGPDSERACCSPEAVIAARETCHALGLPHVTLDLRDEFRRAVVDPFVRALRARRDAESVRALQRQLPLRRAARVRRACRRARSSGPATTRASSSATAGGCSPAPPTPKKDQSYMLAPLDPRLLDRIEFPLGEQDKEATRAEAAAAGLAVAERRESQEACFLAGDDYRAFLGRHGLAAAEGRSSTRAAASSAGTSGFWRYTPGQRRGLGVAAAEPLYALRTDAATNTVVVGPRALARVHERRGAAAGCTSRSTAPRRSCATARPRCPARVDARAGGFRLELDEPAYAVAPGQVAALYDGRRRRRVRLVSSASAATRISAHAASRRHRRGRRVLRAGALPRRRRGSALAYMFFRWAEPSRASPRSSRERSASCCP